MHLQRTHHWKEIPAHAQERKQTPCYMILFPHDTILGDGLE